MSFARPDRPAADRRRVNLHGDRQHPSYRCPTSAVANTIPAAAIYGSGAASGEISRKHPRDDASGWSGPSKWPRAAAAAVLEDVGTARRLSSYVPSYAPSTSAPSASSFPRFQLRRHESITDEDRERQERPEGHTVVFMSRDEIERCSPSRKDGIDRLRETYLRYSYCWYLQSLGMRLQLPQSTIGTAIVYCHRFFIRRSHAGNDRYLIATAALFLASKSEESPCPLNSVLRASCEISQAQDFTSFPYPLYGEDWFDQYRERVIAAENVILTTLDFELSVQHPYAPLLSVLGKLGLSQTMLMTLAWNLISEGLRSSLWLQFKPHHIAAGAVFLAARFLNVDLSCYHNIWQEFRTSSYALYDVAHQLMELF